MTAALFAAATMALEDMHPVAVEGQRRDTTPDRAHWWATCGPVWRRWMRSWPRSRRAFHEHGSCRALHTCPPTVSIGSPRTTAHMEGRASAVARAQRARCAWGLPLATGENSPNELLNLAWAHRAHGRRSGARNKPRRSGAGSRGRSPPARRQPRARRYRRAMLTRACAARKCARWIADPARG